MKRCFGFILLILCLSVCWVHGETVLTAWNVGKADCLLLEAGGEAWLIDTGSAESWENVEEWLLCKGITELQGVIITHGDKDHLGGLPGLAMSQIHVSHWYTSSYSVKYPEVGDHPLQYYALQQGNDVSFLRMGDELILPGGKIQVLWPDSPGKVENNDSLVLLVRTEDGTILLMGDAETEDEKEMVERGLISKVDVLKVGHHGQKDATGKKLVKACQPQIAIISTDTEERDESASPEVIKRLTKAGARVLLTQSSPIGVQVTLSEGKVTAALLEEVR